MKSSKQPGEAIEGIRAEALDDMLLPPAAVLAGLPDAVVATAHDGRIVFVNALAEEQFGYTRDELLGERVEILWPPRVRERYMRNMELYFATEHPLRFSTEVWGVRKDGSEFIGEMSWGIVETSGGPLLLAIGRDISDRRAAEARTKAVAALGERALASDDPAKLAAEAVDLLKDTLPIAGAGVRLAGDVTLATFGPPTDGGMHLPIGGGDELFIDADRPLTDEEVSFMRAVANILAIALARLRDELRIRHEAVHDPLTGLANRTLLRDRLEQALARSGREGSETGVLFVDLDNFKQVNDAYGHASGDQVLVELANRLRAAVRPADTVARMGGDEFVIVCEEVDERAALALGQRLRDAIHLPLLVGGAPHEVSASIGVALGQSGADSLLARADSALYRAKARGRGRVELSPAPPG